MDLIGLFALWLPVTAYNLYKPYHVDDAAHLFIAQWIGQHPLHPMSGVLNWSGTDEPIHATNQPHLYFFVMAGWACLFGWSEPAMHALQALFTAACIALLYALGRALAPAHALWVTAMVVLGPAFFVEQNMMVDVPLLATWLLVMAPLAIGAGSRSQTLRFVTVAIGCSGALLIKYSSLVLLPTVWLTLLLERRPRQAWTAAIPLAVLAAWSAFNWYDYGGIHLLQRPARAQETANVQDMALAWVLALGALSPLGILILAQSKRAWSSVSGWIVAGAGLALAVFATLVGSGIVSDHASDQVLRLVFYLNGFIILAALVPDALRLLRARLWDANNARSESARLVLLLWIGATFAFYVLLAPFMAARHILLVIPAVTLLLARRWTKALDGRTKIASLGMMAVVSLAIGVSDWHWAAFYRVEAAKISAMPTGGQRWTSGHWGWQWYSNRQGVKQVDVRRLSLAPGDLLALPDEVDRSRIEDQATMLPVAVETQSPLRFDPFCTQRPNRFYYSTKWTAPWSLSSHCADSIKVYRIEHPTGPAN